MMPAAMTPDSIDGLATATSPPSGNHDQNEPRSPRNGDSDAAGDNDQKTKKRIQNRVAQRTYRNRMKQRVQDLEQQLCEMRARQQQAQFAYGPEYTPALNPDGSVCLPAGGSGVSSIWQPSPAVPRHPGMPAADMWPGLGHEGPRSSPHDVMHGFQTGLFPGAQMAQPPFPHAPAMSPLNLPTSSLDQLPHGMLGGDLDGTPVSPMHKLEADKAMLLRMAANGGSPGGPEDDAAGPWSQSPYLMSPGSSRLGTVPPSSSGGGGHFSSSHSPWGSIATAPTDASEGDDGAPTPTSSIEERFEYVLDCARKVGFETFDTMASQYYATNFEASSSLAMDQRVSRNRHLPALLGDLRQNSANWSVWERRGYQDETLKAAEEICAIECRDFRAGADPVTLATVQQRLPNVWALLTGLASGTPLQRQGDRTALVYNSIQQLCVLGDAITHDTN